MTDAQQPADPERPACPEYHPGSARPELNRPVRERYPQIRSTSGYGDPGSAAPVRARERAPTRNPSAPRN